MSYQRDLFDQQMDLMDQLYEQRSALWAGQEQPTNATNWPRKAVSSIECRRRDLVVRIADWTKTKDEPAYDVEVYVGGVYDYGLSKTFTTKSSGQTKKEARTAAVAFAAQQIAALL